MENSLQVTMDVSGNFKDAYERPMMIVFQTKTRAVRARKTSSKTAIGLKKTEVGTSVRKQASCLFEFVNVTGQANIDGTTRTLIKKHVMKEYRRRERDCEEMKTNYLESMEPLQQATPPSVADVLEFPNSSSSPVAYLERLCFGSLDPFAQFPVTMLPHMYDLAYKYLTLVRPVTCPDEPYSELSHTGADWFDLAMQDAALFHVIIGGAAMYFDLLGVAKRSWQRDLHIMTVLHLLVNRIKTADSGISDSTIAVVAFLAQIQCIMGNFEQWSMHIDGLERMIKMRGGQHSLEFSLQCHVYRADMMGCVDFGSRPRFASIDGSLGPNQHMVMLPFPNRTSTIEVIAIAQNLSPDLIYAVKSIQHLTDCITEANIQQKPMDSRYTDKMVTMIRRLVRTASLELEKANADVASPDINWSSVSSTQEALRLGTLIYLKALIAQPPFPRVPPMTLISRFQSALGATQPDNLLTPLLLWLAFTGGMFLTPDRGSERAWFVRYAAMLSHGLPVTHWKSAKELLVMFWWVESVHEEESRKFWMEVEAILVQLD